ncbi:MAG: hypothetical protein Q7U66_08470 [Methylobacter sp.]|nr:hypothetical protein [Methylobacter sp.]
MNPKVAILVAVKPSLMKNEQFLPAASRTMVDLRHIAVLREE